MENVGDAVDAQLKQREDEGIFDDYEPYLHICNLRPSQFNVKNTNDFLKVVKIMSGGLEQYPRSLIVSNGSMDFHDFYQKARDKEAPTAPAPATAPAPPQELLLKIAALEEEKQRDRVKIAALEEREKAAEAAIAAEKAQMAQDSLKIPALEEELKIERNRVAKLREYRTNLERDLQIERQKVNEVRGEVNALRMATSSDDSSSSEINRLQEELIKVREEFRKQREALVTTPHDEALGEALLSTLHKAPLRALHEAQLSTPLYERLLSAVLVVRTTHSAEQHAAVLSVVDGVSGKPQDGRHAVRQIDD